MGLATLKDLIEKLEKRVNELNAKDPAKKELLIKIDELYKLAEKSHN